MCKSVRAQCGHRCTQVSEKPLRGAGSQPGKGQGTLASQGGYLVWKDRQLTN